MRRPFLLLPVLPFLLGCFSVTGINRFQPNLYTVDQEIGLGKEMSRQVEKELSILHHAALQEMIGSMGRRIEKSAPQDEFDLYPFTFQVVDSSEINAFALPGGPIYLNMGLVEIAETEAELASVMAHEMSHVVLRHATERITALQLSQLALLAVLTTVGAAPPLAMQGARLGYVLGILQYSQAMESNADDVALRALAAAGYDPQGMTGMFRHIQERRRQQPVLLERLLSSHPLADERIREAREEIETLDVDWRKNAGERQPSRFAEVKAIFAKD